MLRIVIFFLCLINFVDQLVVGGVAKQINEQNILDTLFSETDLATLSISETKDYLEDLNNLYSIRWNKALASSATKKIVLELVQLPEQANCFEEEVYKNFNRLYRDHRIHKNIANFIKYYRNWYTRRCKGELSDAYFKSVSLSSNSERHKLLNLVKDVRSLSENRWSYTKLFYTEGTLAEATYNFFERELAADREMGISNGGCTQSKMSWRNFKELYKIKVGQLCAFLVDDFKKMPKNFLKKAIYNRNVVASLDSFTADRLVIASVCYDIENNNGRLMEKVWTLVEENCK